MRKGIVLLFLAVIAAASTPHPQRRQLVRRQVFGGGKDTPPVASTTPPPAGATTPATSATQPPANVPPASSTPTTPTTPPTTPASTPSPAGSNPASLPESPLASSPPAANTSPSLPTDTQPTQPQQNSPAPPASDTAAAPVNTDTPAPSNTVTIPASGTQDPASSAAQSATKKPDNDSGVSMGTIIGLSVAGGVAAIAIIGFIIWKLTRKRFPDFDTDNTEAIKWPELNNNHAASTGDLSRAPSNAPSDPYAVPPLPQFNPNQPYRDDPNAGGSSGYYDPYRGPIPQTFQDDMGENIPMSTYPPSTRGRSPGPAMAYEVGGRGSPVPGRVVTPMAAGGYDAGVGRTITPAPAGGPPYIPGAQPEMARYHSPGPNMYG